MSQSQAETSLRQVMKGEGFFVHKWRDRGFVSCPVCHKQIKICPHCKQLMLLPKAQTLPDYLVARSYAYIECKFGRERWSLLDVSETQETVLDGYPEDSWIFLELSVGRAPLGRKAYLIPWLVFKDVREKLITEGQKSVIFSKSSRSRIREADDVFGRYALVWAKSMGWQIPLYHVWRGYK